MRVWTSPESMRRELLLLLVLAPGCGMSTLDVAAVEAQRNREALLELRARGVAERAAAAERGEGSGDASARAIPELPTVVLAPERGPSALTAEGALRREALVAFHARGPHALLGTVELAPGYVDGRVVGLLVRSIDARDGAWAEAGGLRVGDIVTRVNGRQISMPDNFVAVWDALPMATDLRVSLRRGDEVLDLGWAIVDE